MPGQQYSSSVENAKLQGTYICSFKLKGDTTFNRLSIYPIFAEHQYWREDNLFYQKKIDCCESQLLIYPRSERFGSDTTGYGIDWRIKECKNDWSMRPAIYFKGTLFPDSLPLTIVSLRRPDSGRAIKTIWLYKVK